MAFTPFMQGSKAQSIIDGYLNDGGYSQAQPKIDLNSAGNFRNPIFDLRTEQENAGTLTPEDLFPNPQLDFSAPDTPVDPCPEGFMLVDGICQPIETFGQSMYQEDNDRDDPEQRPYMSIEDMRNASDYDLLKYLSNGSLANDKLGFLPSKLGEEFFIKQPFPNSLTMGLSFLGLNNQEIRRNAMLSELAKRGYDLDTKQGQLGLTQTMGIIGNADAANKGGNKLATNQPSIFTPDEINYQIQAKQDAQNIVNQGGNAYQTPQMTQQQVINDAQQSGGSVNQFEAQNINAYTPPPQAPFAVNYDDAYGAGF